VAHRAEAARPAGGLPVAHAGVADGTRFVDLIGDAEFIVRDGALPLPPLPQGALILQEA